MQTGLLLDLCAYQRTVMFDLCLVCVLSHAWLVCTIVSGSCPSHVQFQI